MNAIQWMVRTPDPKRFMHPRQLHPVEEVARLKIKLADVLAYTKKPTLDRREWAIAHGVGKAKANEAIKQCVDFGLIECISNAYTGGRTGIARPAVFKAIDREA